MSNYFGHDPEAARKIRDGHYGTVEPMREGAKLDPDLMRQLEARLGNGAYAFTEVAKQLILPAHESGWTSVADGHQSTADEVHKASGELMHADGDGGASVRRSAPDA
ncbi:hypothetical protein AB4305_28945 [Nocardia sp. 2YAB30]|uniref:hypothetical protein n=1 Tax=Nocardia sp. 2YAB30 TaxID=3233022 RepID=UPI003F983FF1